MTDYLESCGPEGERCEVAIRWSALPETRLELCTIHLTAPQKVRELEAERLGFKSYQILEARFTRLLKEKRQVEAERDALAKELGSDGPEWFQEYGCTLSPRLKELESRLNQVETERDALAGQYEESIRTLQTDLTKSYVIASRYQEALEAATEVIENYVPRCDEDMHPAWCINHQTKRCTGNADLDRWSAARRTLQTQEER